MTLKNGNLGYMDLNLLHSFSHYMIHKDLQRVIYTLFVILLFHFSILKQECKCDLFHLESIKPFRPFFSAHFHCH